LRITFPPIRRNLRVTDFGHPPEVKEEEAISISRFRFPLSASDWPIEIGIKNHAGVQIFFSSHRLLGRLW
jgi:hypothetical protein